VCNAKQHGGIVHLRKTSQGYCVGLGFSVWCIHSKHGECACSHAHPRALREGQTRREAVAQSLRASYVWEVAGLPNRAVGQQSSAIREGERMRPSTGSNFDATQRCQACLLLVCSMERQREEDLACTERFLAR
jgi:hypothetical protein